MYEDGFQGLYVLTQRLQCGRNQRLVVCDGDGASSPSGADLKGVTLTNGVFHCWSESVIVPDCPSSTSTLTVDLVRSMMAAVGVRLCGFLVATRRRVGRWLHLSLLSCPPAPVPAAAPGL